METGNLGIWAVEECLCRLAVEVVVKKGGLAVLLGWQQRASFFPQEDAASKRLFIVSLWICGSPCSLAAHPSIHLPVHLSIVDGESQPGTLASEVGSHGMFISGIQTAQRQRQTAPDSARPHEHRRRFLNGSRLSDAVRSPDATLKCGPPRRPQCQEQTHPPLLPSHRSFGICCRWLNLPTACLAASQPQDNVAPAPLSVRAGASKRQVRSGQVT